MKAEYLNPFLKSVVQILENMLDQAPSKGSVFVREKYPYESGAVAVVVGVTGALSGQVALTMERETALAMAAVLLMEDSVDAFDAYAQSALAETANMIVANATIGLSESGYICDITPPTIITGTSLRISCKQGVKTLVIPLRLSFGEVEVNLSVAESEVVKQPPRAFVHSQADEM